MSQRTPLNLTDIRSPGWLWAFAFEDGRASIAETTTALSDKADWHWSHFALSDQRSRLFLDRHSGIPEIVRACLLGSEPRLQMSGDGEWTFGVLPDFEHELQGSAFDVHAMRFAFNGQQLITTRRHPLQVVDLLRREVERGATRLIAPADAIAAHIARFINATETRLLKLATQLDHIEDQLLAGRSDVDQTQLGPVRRELSAYHRAFGSLRSVLHRSATHRGGGGGGGLGERLAPLLLEIEDFDRDLSGQQERARLLRDELETQAQASANRSLRALTILSTLLLPPTLIVGAFGMNVRGIPFAEQPGGFYAASLLCIVVVAVCYAALRQARIL